MLSIYPACFFKEENGYSVVFPDLNYLATCGEDLNDAMCMAVDCLAGYLHSCKIDGTAIQEPSDISCINIDAVSKELSDEESCTVSGFVNLVSVDVEAYAKEHFNKSVKKTLSIPIWLNDAAIEEGINFSQTLQEALKQKLSLVH